MEWKDFFVKNKENLMYGEYPYAWAVKIKIGKVLAEFTFSKKEFESLDAVKKYIFEVDE